MSRRVTFHEVAELEIVAAINFSQAEQPELGATLINEIEGAVHQIVQYPFSCQLINRTTRRKVLRRFPYDIIYSVKPDMIRILALASQRRRPFYWRRRR
jgi:plasmid stabilization system protein ParE